MNRTRRQTRRLRHRLVAVSSLAALGLASCGGSDGGDALVIATTTTEVETAPTDAPIDTAAAEPTATEPVASDAPATVAPTTASPEAEPEPDPVDDEAIDGDATDDEATDDEATDDGVTDEGAPDEGAPDDAATEEPVSDGDDGAAEVGADAPGGDDSCLEGSWIIDSEQLNSYYAALAADSGAGLTLGADGIVNVSFFDGEYQYAADFVLTLEVAGTSGTGVASGTVDGSYTVADGVITAETENSSLDITVTVSGVTMDGSELGNDLLTSSPINNAPFTCGAAGEGPTLMFQSGPSPDQRHPVVLKAF
jgi:hypothetical protein